MSEEGEKPKPLLEDWRVRGVAAAGVVAGFLIGLVIFGAPWRLPPAWGDIPTWLLALGAAVTSWYAVRAFSEQHREVAAIERQVEDGQEVARQQAKLLELQGEQLLTQREQFAEQRDLNKRQAEVLELQAAELRESLEERRREAALRYRDQASRVFISETHHYPGDRDSLRVSGTNAPIRIENVGVRAYVKNTSDQPVYSAELRWHRGSAGYGQPNPRLIGTIMPGADWVEVREFPDDTNLDVSGAVLTFRDAVGVTWMRRPDGGLTEQQ